MKRIVIAGVLVSLCVGGLMAGPKIKETESAVSKKELKESIGLMSIDFKILERSYFKFVMDKTKEGIIEDPALSLAVKKRKVEHLASFENERKNCLVFWIRHTKPLHRTKDGVVIRVTDAKGKSVPCTFLDTTLKWSGDGTMYEQLFFIKPEKWITKTKFLSG
jgi:hypothetical protein